MVDQDPDRLRGRHEAARGDLEERDRNRSGLRRRREIPREIGGQRAALSPEAHQEQRLGLTHDVARHSDHHIVELPVREVVLDARSADPDDRSVHDVQLPVVGATDVVLAPVEFTLSRVEPVLVPGKHVVDDDLRSRVGKTCEHRLGGPVRLAARGIQDDPDLDALLQLPHKEVRERRPDLTLAPAEHENVNGSPSLLDVGEDARVEVLPLGPRLDRRRGRPGVGHAHVGGTRVFASREALRRDLRTAGRDRSDTGRPARLLHDCQHLTRREEEERCDHEAGDRKSRPPPARGAPRRLRPGLGP